MFRKWMQLIVIASLMISLAGCGKSLEAQINSGLNLTQTVFAAEPEQTTESVGSINFYLPTGFKIEKSEDKVNVLLSKGTNSYILFVNEQEDTDSELNYKLLKQDTTKKIIKEKTFKQDDVFGFSAVMKNSDNTFELVVSYGGVKMTTISAENEVENNLEDMLKIVRSVKWNNNNKK